jgi:hypothetical protein
MALLAMLQLNVESLNRWTVWSVDPRLPPQLTAHAPRARTGRTLSHLQLTQDPGSPNVPPL